MIEIGRIYVKTAGRDAGKKCVITEILDESYVMIDGQTRNKKCNIKHLEPLTQTIEIKPKPSHSDVVSAFNKLGLDIKETKTKKEKSKQTKPKKIRTSKDKEKVESKETKKEVKKEKKSKQ